MNHGDDPPAPLVSKDMDLGRDFPAGWTGNLLEYFLFGSHGPRFPGKAGLAGGIMDESICRGNTLVVVVDHVATV